MLVLLSRRRLHGSGKVSFSQVWTAARCNVSVTPQDPVKNGVARLWRPDIDDYVDLARLRSICWCLRRGSSSRQWLPRKEADSSEIGEVDGVVGDGPSVGSQRQRSGSLGLAVSLSGEKWWSSTPLRRSQE